MATTLTSVWPTLAPTAHFRRPGRRLPYPLEEPGCQIFSRARHGLVLGLRDLGVGPGRRVLMPAWHHGSEVQAVLSAGGSCTFYDPGPDLEPSMEQLEELLDEHTVALHLTHFLGFPLDVARWRAWCDGHGLMLVEDAAQAWLASRDGSPVGSSGDLAVWCLYKTYGLPDGAAVLGARSRPHVGRPSGLTGLLHRHAAWVTQRRSVPTGPRRGAPYDPELDFATGEPAPASRATVRLLPRVTTEDARSRRRELYRTYLDELGRFVPPPFDSLPEGAVPFVFPIAVRDKSSVVRAFEVNGCRALDMWSVPHPALDVPAHPHAAWLRRHLVGLPVHQGITDKAQRGILALSRRLLSVEDVPEPGPWFGTSDLSY